MSDGAAIAALVEAIDRVDRGVAAVLGLADGGPGSGEPDGRSWLARRLVRRGGVHGVARPGPASDGTEQLRAASRAADDVIAAVARLRRSNDQRVFELLARLDRLALSHLGHELSEMTPASPELVEIQHRLSDARAAATETGARFRRDRGPS